MPSLTWREHHAQIPKGYVPPGFGFYPLSLLIYNLSSGNVGVGYWYPAFKWIIIVFFNFVMRH